MAKTLAQSRLMILYLVAHAMVEQDPLRYIMNVAVSEFFLIEQLNLLYFSIRVFNVFQKVARQNPIRHRPSIKDVCTKSRKIDPPLIVRKMSALAQPIHPCPCGHTKNFEKSEVFLQQAVRTPAFEDPPPPYAKCPHWTNPQIADVFYGQPLRLPAEI